MNKKTTVKTKLFFYSWFAVAPADFVRLPSNIKTKIKAGLKNLTHRLRTRIGSSLMYIENTVFVSYCFPFYLSKISLYFAVCKPVRVVFIWIWFSYNTISRPRQIVGKERKN
jgi:hypothetical protein